MQGTQYAPRESILCMEHFVAQQCILKFTYFVDETAFFLVILRVLAVDKRRKERLLTTFIAFFT